MVNYAVPYCTHLPSKSRACFLSGESAKTAIVTLQGIQAVSFYCHVFTSWATTPTGLGLGVDSIFFPISILGLLRLPTALWLTDEHSFITYRDVVAKESQSSFVQVSAESLLARYNTDRVSVGDFRQVSSWISRIFRTVFVSILVFIVSLSIRFVGTPYQTTTSLVMAALYIVMLVSSIVILSVYFYRGLTTTTIIPCISSWWYKAYTFVVAGLMLTSLVVAAIETKRTPCGQYTSWPQYYGDRLLCQKGDKVVLYIGSRPESDAFGVASKSTSKIEGSALRKGEFWVDDFSGTCIGSWPDESRRRASTISMLEIPLRGKNYHHRNDTLA
ncbi:hypothetical protein F4810DRAFT_697802 [Camillea tinctor]|nr:hypothetical protein F4810DRAFT_697802 [Camillea tinctor]